MTLRKDTFCKNPTRRQALNRSRKIRLPPFGVFGRRIAAGTSLIALRQHRNVTPAVQSMEIARDMTYITGPDDIVVMDNMRTHHSKAVKKVIDELKINVIYLPPYSPDFNPIENMWSKIKAILRKLRARVLSELRPAIELAFSFVSFSDCLGWFWAAGL